jgi:hypothetical protein
VKTLDYSVNSWKPIEGLIMSNLTPPEASDYLEKTYNIRRKPPTLAKLRCIGGSPRFFKAGHGILYPENGLDEWAIELLGDLRDSTSMVG